MRSDLERLMKERGLAGMVVLADDRYSPAMYYVTGEKITHGVYFRGADGRAHLIVNPMERDQAARAGCDVSTFPQQGLNRLIEEEKSAARGLGRLIGQTCATLGIQGTVAFYGDSALGSAWQILERARTVNPTLSVDVALPDLLSVVRTTKDEAEIAAIRRAAAGAVDAIARVRAWLSKLRRDGDRFGMNGSRPATLGDLRRLIQGVYLEHGLTEDGESIVSQGRDAGVPHNRGNDDEPLKAATPILIDIFPGEAGGGYHSDLTRTFCLGPAPEPLKKLYGDCRDAFRAVMDDLKVGAPCRSYQERVCDLYEQRGHATLRTSEITEEGYVHGLGHGVGLAVHEAPRLGGPPSNAQTLAPGMVITVEPGLYYPSQGLGVRIEDLVLVRSDGTFENLTPAAYDLEIEPRG
ncbi:MAG: M24 family metallopeptidase [Candidatus Eisenbacteria bacterium]|nr:M24 family metallopeptidase [Candidatus Eisenbacteria bacterium]